jgi:predicted DsbA family dithiol-disulfide isomerase/uncharacterized membrane protein
MIHRIAMQSERSESPEASLAPSAPRKWMPALLVWFPTVLGLAVSAMLLVDYVRPAPIFCEENAGCDVVKRTVFASVLGIPTPAYGLAAFTVLAVLALVRGTRPRLAHLAVASIAALVGLALVFVQFLMGVYCKYCLVVDVATLVILVGAVARTKAKWELPAGRKYPALLASVFALAVALPLVVGFLKPVPVPQVITEELNKTPPGMVTIVDFVDFECPFCRMTQAELAPVVAANRSRIRVVRKQVPLRMHPHAMDAARAACCAERLGKGDEMADALFTAPLEELTPDGCEKIAASLGLDPGAFRDCAKDPKTDDRIKSDVADFKASRGHGLPTIWIETQKLEGAQPGEVLESAVKTALSKKS